MPQVEIPACCVGKQWIALEQIVCIWHIGFHLCRSAVICRRPIEHGFVICTGDLLELSDLPPEIRTPALRTQDCQSRSSTKPSEVTHVRRRRVSSREELIDLLDECDWNRTAVADRLGISRVTVWRKMKRWGIPLEGDE